MEENKEIILQMIVSVLSKGRNIVYYRTIDDRPRATYIHVLRDYRKQLLNTVVLLPDEYSEDKSIMLSLIKVIDPKVKTEECMGTIIKMSEILKGTKYAE